MKRNRNGISLFLKRKIDFFETENHWPYHCHYHYHYHCTWVCRFQTIAHITAPSTANIPSTCDYSLLWRSYRTESSMTSVANSLLTLCMTVGCFTTAMTASWNPRLNRVSTRRCCTFMQHVSHSLYTLILTVRHNHAVQTSSLTRCRIESMANPRSFVPHNHNPDIDAIQVATLKATLKERAGVGDVQPAQLLAEALLNASDAAKDHTKMQAGRRGIRRYRQGMVPPEPATCVTSSARGRRLAATTRSRSRGMTAGRTSATASSWRMRVCVCSVARTPDSWTVTFRWRHPCLTNSTSFVLRSARRASCASTPCCRARARRSTWRCWRPSLTRALRSASTPTQPPLSPTSRWQPCSTWRSCLASRMWRPCLAVMAVSGQQVHVGPTGVLFHLCQSTWRRVQEVHDFTSRYWPTRVSDGGGKPIPRGSTNVTRKWASGVLEGSN